VNPDARKFFSVACWISCVVCAVLATSALSRDEGEVLDYIDADLPADAFLQYSRIGHDYGTFAATYWRYAVYERSPEQARASCRRTPLLPAVAQFCIRPMNPRRIAIVSVLAFAALSSRAFGSSGSHLDTILL
jgi:hypothetical protein